MSTISNWDFIKSKIQDHESFDRTLALWRFRSHKIGFTNGCFDILHPGHIEYLYKASQECDVLVLALNTDSSVKRLKGEDRPIQNQEARATVIAGLGCVDAVVFFDQDTPLELIKKIRPHILFKGSDYQAEKIVGYSEMLSWGGEVKTIDFVEGFSSSSIIEKSKK